MTDLKKEHSDNGILAIVDDDKIFEGSEEPFEIKNPSKDGEDEPFSNVIGHENQKKELLSVVNWFKHSKELKEKGVSIPRGVILFGEPGNGKSLFIKEFVKCADAPVFVFRGENDNVVAGIIETFQAAREKGHAIIVFDELDLLIDRDRRVIRALQENLDGIETNDDILVLAATNDLSAIPDALLRNGRLEKLIFIPYPTGEEALKLFKKHYDAFHLEYPEDFDDEEISLSLNNISCAGIKAVVNDIVLRNGFKNITSKMIDDSICSIADRVKEGKKECNLQIAIHEAGHAILTRSFPEYFLVNRLAIDGPSGKFCSKEVNEGFWPYDKIIADIKICMGGVLAEKVLCGKAGRGEESDLQRARKDAYNLFNMNGYSSCWETLPYVGSKSRTETQIKRRRMERKIERLLRRCERETRKYIKKNKDKVYALGKLLYEKKHLKSSEVLSCIG